METGANEIENKKRRTFSSATLILPTDITQVSALHREGTFHFSPEGHGKVGEIFTTKPPVVSDKI